MKTTISKIKHIIWIVRYVYWNKMKASLDVFSSGTQEIKMDEIVSISITIINGIKQICIIQQGQTEVLLFPLTANNLNWFQNFIIYPISRKTLSFRARISGLNKLQLVLF